MSRAAWARTARTFVALGTALSLWCAVPPDGGAQETPPASSEADERSEPALEAPEQPPEQPQPPTTPIAPPSADSVEQPLGEDPGESPDDEASPPPPDAAADIPGPLPGPVPADVAPTEEAAPVQETAPTESMGEATTPPFETEPHPDTGDAMFPAAEAEAPQATSQPDGSQPLETLETLESGGVEIVEAPPSRPPPVEASATRWSFSLTTGYYQPRLGTLNRVLRDTSVTILQDPNFLLPRNQSFPFEQRNIAVDNIKGGLAYGVDMFYNPGGAHSFGLSFSGWRGESFGNDTVSLFLRSNRDPILVPRSARYNLVLDQIFLEWRYHLLRDAEGRGIYVNAGLVGITLAFFTMDSLVTVVDPDLSFASVSSDESFGWGYTTRFGVGGDYPITSWLSIGGRANYVLGNIRTLKVTRHFLAGFPQFPLPDPLQVRPGVPLPQLFFAPRDGRVVSYATVTTTGDIEERAGPETELPLELSGWEGLLHLTVSF